MSDIELLPDGGTDFYGPDENDIFVSEKLLSKEAHETDLKERGVTVALLNNDALEGAKGVAQEIIQRLSKKDRIILLDGGTRVITPHDDLRIKVIYNAEGKSIGIIEN